MLSKKDCSFGNISLGYKMLLIYLYNLFLMSSSFLFKLLLFSLLKMNLIAFTKRDIFIISVISSLSMMAKEKNLIILFIPYLFIYCFKSEYDFILKVF